MDEPSSGADSADAGRIGPEFGLRYVYAAWTGEQVPSAPVSAEAVLGALADDLAAGLTLDAALTRLLRRGLPELPGLVELLAEARRALEVTGHGLASADAAADDKTNAALIGQLAALEQLVGQLAAAHHAGDPTLVDADAVAAHLGSAAGQRMATLQRVQVLLLEAHLVVAVQGRLTLTSAAARRLARRALRRLLPHPKPDRTGAHVGGRHAALEPIHQSRPRQPDDDRPLDVTATLAAAVRRTGPALPVRLQPADFWVEDPERGVGAATVVLLDASRSMLLRGSFAAGRQAALALTELVSRQFRHDELTIYAFARQPRPVPRQVLPVLAIDEQEFGTNIQAALRQARLTLARSRRRNRQVLLITDGEPTAHTRPDGAVLFNYPPTNATIDATFREALACAREHAAIHVFATRDEPALAAFGTHLAHLSRGHFTALAPQDLGVSLVDHFIGHRRTNAARSRQAWHA